MPVNALATTRPPFLLLAPASAAPGVAAAATIGPLDALLVALVLLAALFAHIAVNAFNEVGDFESGLDLTTQRTPFSGGSGTLPADPSLLRPARIIAWVSLLACVAIGLYFVWLRGPLLGLLGALGIGVIAAYTPLLVRRPLLCLVAPGTGFGLVMVIGSANALSGDWPLAACWAALPVFFLVNNLLLLNQLPDIEADRAAGRANLPLTKGVRPAALAYGAMLLGAGGSLLLAVSLDALPPYCLAALLPMLPALPIAPAVWHWRGDIASLMPWLAINVATCLLSPLLLAAGLAWSLRA